MAGPYYTTREKVKLSKDLNTIRDAQIDRIIAARSRSIENLTNRIFVPYIATKKYEWPPHQTSSSYRMWLNNDLLSVTSISLRAEDDSPETLPASGYFLEPYNDGPPYRRIELNAETSYIFGGGQTWQRSVSIVGLWGYTQNTEQVGTLSAAISTTTATTITVSDSSLIGVGDSLVIDSERFFVSDKVTAGTGVINMAAITADVADKNIVVSDATKLQKGEIITIDSERMYVQEVNDNTITVRRKYDGSTLATHASGTEFYDKSSITVQRGVYGSTAATHTNGTAIYKCIVPEDIEQLCIAETIVSLMHETEGYTKTVGGEGFQREYQGIALKDLRSEVKSNYYIRRVGVI